MQLYLFLLVSSSLIASSSGEPYKCNGVQTIDPPANISNPWIYPSTWRTNDDAPQFAAEQNCTWTINVPKGMFAYFVIKANATNSALLQMTDSTGYVTKYDSAVLEPFFLMDPSFTVSLISLSVGTMGMSVYWYKVPQPYPSTLSVHSKSTPVLAISGDFDNATVIQSDTQVSLLSVAPGAQITDLTPYMRSTQIFDGPSINSTLLGNLYQVMASGTNLVSSGKSLTLFSLFPGLTLGNYVILQDYSDVKQFKSYKPVWCVLPNLCQLSLDARGGTAAAIRYSHVPFYAKGASLPQTSKLSVYTDYVTDAHHLADYTATSAKTDLPQEFNGIFTTFVLDQDQGIIDLSSAPTDSRWNVPFEGRHGFFSSPNYALSSTNQNFTEQISGAKTFNVSYTVKSAPITGAAKLQVTIFDGQKAVVDNVYSSSNVPGGTVRSRGDNILVKYMSNGEKSTGAFVDFQFDKYNSANSFSLFGAVVVALWVALTV